MDLGPTILIIIFLVLNFTFMTLDFEHNSNMKQSIFEATRAANQNSLYELQDKYDTYEEITTSEMLEKWLINFCNNNSLNFDKINVSFVQIETDPVPLYLVNIEGQKGAYAIIKNKDAIAEFYNGAMLIEKEEGENHD